MSVLSLYDVLYDAISNVYCIIFIYIIFQVVVSFLQLVRYNQAFFSSIISRVLK